MKALLYGMVAFLISSVVAYVGKDILKSALSNINFSDPLSNIVKYGIIFIITFGGLLKLLRH